MKQSFKHTTSLVSLSFAIALVPTLSFAIEAQPDNQQPTTTGGQSSFCRSLSDITTKTSGEISSRSGKLSSTRDTADKERSSDRSSVDAKLMADRKTWETKRDENFSKLESLAKTPEQKAAVATYVKTIKNAIETRQMANDKARTQYRTAVDALIAAHRSAVDTRVATFTNSVKTAVATAKATCATNPKLPLRRSGHRSSKLVKPLAPRSRKMQNLVRKSKRWPLPVMLLSKPTMRP
ncbi:hypothetical protein IPF89_04985 [Candidatus Saccharibacteria bacterium]|nr:MAG: hypothetical protein IPF89_04985 [Candidatus Saccharibacteria bacterium]